MAAIQCLGGRTRRILSGKIFAEHPVAAVRRGGRVVECTGLENRRPFTGLVSSNLTLSAICAIKMGPVRGSYFDCAEQGPVLGCDQLLG
jgi:hypothetical protein